MKNINNRWYDDNGNSWDCVIHTEEEAQMESDSLIDCSGCSD